MDSISIIRTPIESELEAFKELYDSSLSSSNTLLDSVVAHIRQRSGKMMRPILVLLVARLYGVVSPATLHAAVSLELLHNASLVHDDVVDESTERRGQLSVNAIFNNKVAVLTGGLSSGNKPGACRADEQSSDYPAGIFIGAGSCRRRVAPALKCK